jgi:hypothetical protein
LVTAGAAARGATCRKMTAEKKEAMKFFPFQPISIGENIPNPMKRNR